MRLECFGTKGTAMTSHPFPEAIGLYFTWIREPAWAPCRQSTETYSLGRCILVIDDDDTRSIIRDRLRTIGFDILEAENGQIGPSYMTSGTRKQLIHGVLLNLHMPVLSGMAVLQEFRERHTDVPVIVMSGMDDITTVRDAIKLGAQEYLLKPFDLELLKKKCFRGFLN
ncbi:response regulator [Nitrospira sp. BLG_2]|uniref:response regulator n=1 Tax=Nitrospira sp. BLG_2 TaxID=3397507 RepID=UPI003B9D4DBF